MTHKGIPFYVTYFIVLFLSISVVLAQETASGGGGAGAVASSAPTQTTAPEPTKETTQTTTTQPTTETTTTTTTPTEPKEITPIEVQPVSPPPEIKPIETQPVCPSSPKPITCNQNEGLKSRFDDKGCVVGYECTSVNLETACPEVPPSTISCREGEQLNKLTDDKGCIVGYNCVSTVPHQTTQTCPPPPTTKPECRDGNVVPIISGDGCVSGYNCIPSGCRQDMDPKNGFSRIVCETATAKMCPAEDEQAKHKQQCISQGGNPVAFSDPSGCTFYDCRFTKEGVLPDPIRGHEKCPAVNEIDDAIRSCRATGLFGAIAFEGGCKIVKCVQQQEKKCKTIDPGERLMLEESCQKKNLPVLKDYDENGCATFRCGENKQDFCPRDVPPEAFRKCQEKGGEMVVKKDEKGCVAYSSCVQRGDERDAYVAPVENVPEPTELLQVALKLEQLKVELKRLTQQANDIASFYSNSGEEDEARFQRVASMFDSAVEKVDEIRNKIRNNLDSLTTDDLLEIKRDLKQFKDVMLKDIVYVMLSNSDEVKETIKASKQISVRTAKIEDVQASGSNCGTDGLCFDRAFRVCKPVAFQPEGRSGPIITVVGVENNICLVKARLPEDQGPPPGTIPGINPPYEMTCRFKDYSFGVRGPEDFLPNCEGPMVELMKKFGTEGPGGQGGQRFEGPGGCNGPEECDDFCRSNPNVCLEWCEDNPGICPQEKVRGGIEEFREPQRSQEFEASRGFGQQSGGIKCPDGICDDFERSTGACAQDCGKLGIQSSEGDRCDCTWAAGSREHPRGCPVLCSNYPDQALCEAQANNGCAWSYGIGPSQPVQRALQEQPVSKAPQQVQACVGCLNNGVCDIGECSECIDCLRR